MPPVPREQPMSDRLLIRQLEALLDEQTAQRGRLEGTLTLRNAALDAARSHFMIVDVRAAGGPAIVYVNRALARDHGYAPEELLGKDPAMLMPADLNTEQLKKINRAARSGASLSVEIRSRRKDGSLIWTGISIEPIRNAAGEVTHNVSIGADITARLQEAEEKRKLQDRLFSEMQERERMAIELRVAQKLEAVGRLAAGIAHEINTPVQYIGDSLSFLQSSVTDIQALLRAYREAFEGAARGRFAGDVPAEIREIETRVDMQLLDREVPRACERALDGVARVARIVAAMKEFAHPEQSEQSLADLNHAIETTLTVAHGEYKYLATIETQFGPIPEVICHVGELNQVFLNLIVNAAHAIQQAGKDSSTGRITISTAVAEPWVDIVIADNGCGIPQENLDKIFDPFFTTKEVGRGTGQGLAIARAIVIEKHGGSINVHSTVDIGTRFCLRLPIAGRKKGGQCEAHPVR
jgi:PAS domain S-box-containing protein